jgi:hypothetical protein
MKVENGKWVDQYGDPVNNFNVSDLMEIRQKVEAVYGREITSSRIDIISSIVNLSEKEENSLAHLLNRDDVSFSKLAGF